MVSSIDIKPKLTRQVDPGLGSWTGPSLLKNRPCNDPAKPGRPMTWTRPLFFFFLNVVFLLYPFFSYFFGWLFTLFKVHYINIRKMFYFFNMRFRTLYIYTLCFQEKSYFFNMGFETL
jgi:hypothetical protein